MEKFRPVIAPIVLLLMLALFVAGGFWGYRAMTLPLGTTPTPVPTCIPQTADDLTPDMVSVNVYNVDTKPGHAREIADMLIAAGFVVNTIGNASHPVLEQAVVVGTALDTPEVLLVAGFFLGVKIEADGRADHSVDIYIANALETLNPEAPTSVDVKGDSVCLPSIAPKPPSETPTPTDDAPAPEGEG
ncbi:MAG: LytR C-terminal domain-containing protein [Propionibacteriaceae bacterium]|jgi:hypothetical protein|nr:LytR C-terminal domain-containing protein [Propionibacteriaceae bacterium]